MLVGVHIVRHAKHLTVEAPLIRVELISASFVYTATLLQGDSNDSLVLTQAQYKEKMVEAALHNNIAQIPGIASSSLRGKVCLLLCEYKRT